jgi:hypothetical protein
MGLRFEAHAEDTTAKPLRRKLTSRSDVKARSAVLEAKKRHVKKPTRLPTKRMATACWAFIVATRIGRKTAPMLDFSALRVANTKTYKQLMHRCLWVFWGQKLSH